MGNDNFSDEEISNLYNSIQGELTSFWNYPRGNHKLVKKFMQEILENARNLNLL